MDSTRVSSAAEVVAPIAPRGPVRARVVNAVCAAITIVALGWAFAQMLAYEASPLTLEGVAVPERGDPEPFVRELAQLWYDTELSLDAGARVERFTRRELGASLDVDRTLEEVRLLRGDAPIWSRASAFLAGRDRALRFHRVIHAEETTAAVDELSRRASVEPEAVRYDGSGGQNGSSISRVGATSAIADALHVDALFVRLPVRRLAAPAPTLRDRQSARFDEVVAAHETRYVGSGELEGRARNIYLAARFLDGAVIEPRGSLSFNQVVGERSFERGFAPAIELTRGGRRTEGIGGGVCQVAATLHAAAFFAGFDILEHHPHTRNSSYIPAGLDAAVSWPSRDVRIQNPHPFHVRVRATAHRGRLRIELMGARRAPRVEWNTHVVRRIPRETQREVAPHLSPGMEELLDEGEDGSLLERTRTVYWPDGPVTERVELRYPVVHRLVRVAPGARSTGESPTPTGPAGAEI